MDLGPFSDPIWVISSDIFIMVTVSIASEICTYTIYLGLHLTFSKHVLFSYLDTFWGIVMAV